MAANFTWTDASGNSHRLIDPIIEFTKLTYIDKETEEKHVISLPPVTDISYNQDVGLPSRPTINGDFRQQFTRKKVPTFTFNISLAKRLNEDLNELFAEGKIIKGSVDSNNSVVDINTAVLDIGYTSAQFIEMLEDLKDNNVVFSLETSSPLNDQLYDLVITNIGYKHSSQSREIIACSVTCNRVHLVDIKSVVADKIDVLGFISEVLDADAPDVIPGTFSTVQSDGYKRFHPRPLDYLDLVLGNRSLNNDLGTIIARTVDDDYAPHLYIESREISFASIKDQVFNWTFQAESTYHVTDGMYDIGEQIPSYWIQLLDLQITTRRKPGGYIMRPMTFGNMDGIRKGSRAPSDMGYSSYNRDSDIYNIATTYSHLNIDAHTDDYIDTEEFAEALRDSEFTEGFDSSVDAMPQIDTRVIRDTEGFIYAHRLSEQYEFDVKYKKSSDDKWKTLLTNNSLLGGFKVYPLEINVDPTFIGWSADSKYGDTFQPRIVDRWMGTGDSASRTLPETVTVYVFLYTIGDKLRVYVFCPDVLGLVPKRARVFI